jgi:Rrf2 family protein
MLLPRPVLHGIYTLCFLSRFERGAVVSARDIAQAVQLPPEQTSKVLRALTAAGMVTAQRGRQGGYCLARPLEQVNLAQVYAAVCVPESQHAAPHGCLLAARHVCSAIGGLGALYDEFWHLLQHKSMASLVGRPCSKRLLSTAPVLSLPAADGRKPASVQ